MACASLAMYDFSDPVRHANDRLWIIVRDRLRQAGFAAPDGLDRTTPYDDVWLNPDLVLAQTCGYPFVKALAGKVRLVATPLYRFPGARGANRASFVVVRESDRLRSIADLRDRPVAINDWMSNSGMNLLRALVAPYSADGRFFRDVVLTGGHLASLDAVKARQADAAAIDSVTYGLLALHAPESLEGLHILAETPYGPGLPFITRRDASDDEVALLRTTLAEIAADPAHQFIAAPLGLIGIEILNDEAYRSLMRLEEDAAARNYPAIA